MSVHLAHETSSHPGRDPRRRLVRRYAGLAAAAILVLAAIAASAPTASASTGRAARPSQAGRAGGAARSLLGSGSPQRAVILPATVSVGNGPDGLAIDPATHTLYTSNQNSGSVSVINIAACNARHIRGCRQRVHSVSLPAGAARRGLPWTGPPAPST